MNNQYLDFYKDRSEFLEEELKETINDIDGLRKENTELRATIVALKIHIDKMQDLNEVLLNEMTLLKSLIDQLKKHTF